MLLFYVNFTHNLTSRSDGSTFYYYHRLHVLAYALDIPYYNNNMYSFTADTYYKCLLWVRSVTVKYKFSKTMTDAHTCTCIDIKNYFSILFAAKKRFNYKNTALYYCLIQRYGFIIVIIINIIKKQYIYNDFSNGAITTLFFNYNKLINNHLKFDNK